MRIAAIAAAIVSAAALIAAPAIAQTPTPEIVPEPYPIMVGGEATLDACGAVGEVGGLNEETGDGFLAVRTGPGGEYPKRGELYNNNIVVICGQVGDWFAVLYPEEGDPDADCGVSSPIPQAREYQGPCEAGWSHSNWITVIAG